MTRSPVGGMFPAMRHDDPLELWLSSEHFSSAKLARRAEQWIEAVAEQVELPKPNYPCGLSHLPTKLSPRHRERAEALFPRVWQAPGTMKQEAERSLLSLIGATAEPASIPFWKEVLTLNRVRDRLAAERRRTAAAALAYMALRHPKSAAFTQLLALTRHPHEDVRVSAVDIVATLAMNEEVSGPLAPQAAESLRRVASEESAFLPRFLARRFLADCGEPLPAYDHGQAIAFRVSFDKTRRTIELGADQTLHDLHVAILDAFGWDTDHLHQFSLSGDLSDPRFCVPAPDMAPFHFDECDEVESFPLGAIGLPAGHSFAYLYDFGDQNVFKIKVENVHEKVPRVKYPRVTDKSGKASPQYPS